MTTASLCLLPDRAIIRVSGDDAAHLLDGLVTNSLSRLEPTGAIHTGLLSPQGKILFDFFLITDPARASKGFFIDTARDTAMDLIKRLTFYKLRAKADFNDKSDTLSVAVAWGGPVEVPEGAVGYRDPRLAALGIRLIYPANAGARLPGHRTDLEAYEAHRISLGVPDAGADYALSDTFPHEAMYDQLKSVDFRKGCFIGQEVVSRMQHRGTARKRVVPIVAQVALRPGAAISAGEATIGTVCSVAGTSALALVRLDRANEAAAKGEPLLADGQPITLVKPEWADIDIQSGKPTLDR